MDLTYILNQWATSGVFAYVFPFLLVFAVVYGILSKTQIIADNSNKGVNVLIALALGALSLVGDFVPRFFQTLIPYLGMGISILLVLIILGGLFIEGNDNLGSATKWTIWIVGLLIFVVVIYNTLGDYTFSGFYIWREYGSSIIVLAVIIGLIIWVTRGGAGPFSGGGSGPRPY